MSLIKSAADATRSTLDFQAAAPSVGGGIAWSPSGDVIRPTVAVSAVSRYDLVTFDLPPTSAVREMGTFDKNHAFNFVRPHSETLGSGKAFATGDVTFTGVPNNNGFILLRDNINDANYSVFVDNLDSTVETDQVQTINLSGASTPEDVRTLFIDAWNTLAHNTTATEGSTNPGIEAVIDLAFDFPGSIGNSTVGSEQMSFCTANFLTGGVDGGDVPLYGVALDGGAVGDRIRVMISGLARVNAESTVRDGDFLTATTGATTVVQLGGRTGSPRLVLGRALEDYYTFPLAGAEEGTVLMIFNGLWGLGTNGEVYA